MSKLPEAEGCVEIGGSLHCKSQEALDGLLGSLSEEYDVQDCNLDKYSPHDAYFVKLKNSVGDKYCKCNYCGHLNTRVASKCHGYSCEGCGKVLYREYVGRAIVRLYFKDDGDFFMRFSFMIHSYDDAAERLVVYPKVMKGDGWKSQEVLQKALESFRDCYEVGDVPGKSYKLLSFYYPVKGMDRKHQDVKISVLDAGFPPYKKSLESDGKFRYHHEESDEKCHYSSVLLYKGREIDTFPVPEHFMVYPKFRRAPEARNENLGKRIINACGQVADCYYRPGEIVFTDIVLGWMRSYVENFTDIDPINFGRFLESARRDGPGFILQLADYLKKETGVEQEVNRWIYENRR